MKAALDLMLFLLTGITISAGTIIAVAAGVAAIVAGGCWWWRRRARPGR